MHGLAVQPNNLLGIRAEAAIVFPFFVAQSLNPIRGKCINRACADAPILPRNTDSISPSRSFKATGKEKGKGQN